MDAFQPRVMFFITFFLLRIIPHPPNSIPLFALINIAIYTYSGCRSKISWLILSLSALAASDLFLGGVSITAHIGFALLFLTMQIKERNNSLRITRTSGDLLIYWLSTNFICWIESGLYPHTILGLHQCYLSALPFLLHSLPLNLLLVTLFKLTTHKIVILQNPKYSIG